MKVDELKTLAREIVAESRRLSAARTSGLHGDDRGHRPVPQAPVNYACIFAQSATEYDELVKAARQLGPVAQETAMGPVFYIAPLPTVAGNLRLLKIRRPDSKRPEQGDADFTVADYASFKKKYLGQPGFSLIKRPGMEMIELADPSYNVLAYYSHPPLADVLKLNIG